MNKMYKIFIRNFPIVTMWIHWKSTSIFFFLFLYIYYLNMCINIHTNGENKLSAVLRWGKHQLLHPSFSFSSFFPFPQFTNAHNNVISIHNVKQVWIKIFSQRSDSNRTIVIVNNKIYLTYNSIAWTW